MNMKRQFGSGLGLKNKQNKLATARNTTCFHSQQKQVLRMRTAQERDVAIFVRAEIPAPTPTPSPGLRRYPARWIAQHFQLHRKVWSRQVTVCQAPWICRHKMSPMATSPAKTSTPKMLGADCFHWQKASLLWVRARELLCVVC